MLWVCRDNVCLRVYACVRSHACWREGRCLYFFYWRCRHNCTVEVEFTYGSDRKNVRTLLRKIRSRRRLRCKSLVAWNTGLCRSSLVSKGDICVLDFFIFPLCQEGGHSLSRIPPPPQSHCLKKFSIFDQGKSDYTE